MRKSLAQKPQKWKTLSSKIVYENPWIKVKEDKFVKPNGQKGTYSVVQTTGDVVHILPITEKNEIWLVWQYRYTNKKFSWEIPAGGSEGQNSLTAAKRELWEETGFKAKFWKHLPGFNCCTGVMEEKGHVFIAKQLTQTGQNKQLEDGILEMKKVPFRKVIKMIQSGEITDGQTVSAILQAGLYLKLLKPGI